MYNIIALHDRPDLVDACANLLNSEWNRSHGMRTRTLEKSNNEFPLNLVMIENNKNGEKLLGHIRLTRVVGESKALYASSVIIDEAQRGKGLGRKILELTEKYLMPLGFQCLYLQCESSEFYTKCGYDFCGPVQEIINKTFEERVIQLQNLYKSYDSEGETCKTESTCREAPSQSTTCNSDKDTCELESINTDVQSEKVPKNHTILIPPPPPPPPPPLPSSSATKTTDCNKSSDSKCNECQCKYWMKKEF